MVWTMPRPASRSDSKLAQFEARVPADLLPRANGTAVALEFTASATDGPRAVHSRISRGRVRFSLGSADRATVAARQAQALAHLERVWSGLRQTRALTFRETVGLAGEVYRRFLAVHGDEPASPRVWSAVKGIGRAIREGRVSSAPPLNVSDPSADVAAAATAFPGADLTTSINTNPPGPTAPAALEARYGELADYVLATHGLVVDGASRARLLIEIDNAVHQAAKQLKRHAQGDFRPDPDADRFPLAPTEKPGTSGAHLASNGTASRKGGRGRGPTWDAVISAWERRHAAADRQPTVRKQVRDKLEAFAKFVAVAPLDLDKAAVRRWIEHRRAADISPSTINKNDLAFIRRAWKDAQRAGVLPETAVCPAIGEAAERIVGTSPQARRSQRRGYPDDEAALILAAAAKEDDPLYHYAPLLLAHSGARVSEVVCLRACDIRESGGIWVFSVTPDAGRHVKTASSIREVPLAPAALASGFLSFVAERAKSGPTNRLFFDDRLRRGRGVHKPGFKVAERLRLWVRRVCPSAGAANGLDPLHGWRHRFVTLARGAGIDYEVASAIVGHALPGVHGRYGTVPLAAKADAIGRMFPNVSV